MLATTPSAPYRLRAKLSDRAAMHVTALLAALVLFGTFSATALAQGRPSILTPSRDSAPPGATVSIAVNPALAAQQPAGSHLVLRPTRRGGADVELRIVDWRGDAIRASIPRDAGVDAGATRLVLLNRRNEVVANSGNQMFRVAAAGDAPSAGRTAGASGSLTAVPGNGSKLRLPGLTIPDVTGGRGVPERSAVAVVPSIDRLPRPDPRAERAVPARSGDLYTPGIQSQAIHSPAPEAEAASPRPPEKRKPLYHRNTRLVGMDYRDFEVRDESECHLACSLEGQCQSWTLRPPQRNNTYDNGDDGRTCFLKSGIPQREYVRGYVSGIKPPPPASGQDRPPPPVVSR